MLLDIKLGEARLARKLEGDFPEFDGLSMALVLREGSAVELLHELMDAFVRHGHRYVEEHFSFRGFYRFSRKIDPRRIATLSIMSRPYARDAKHLDFMDVFTSSNYQTDKQRGPALGSGPLAEINRSKMALFPGLTGHMPS